MSALSLSRPVLVLDAGYQPVNVVNLKRAVTLVCAGKAVVLQADETVALRSEKLTLHCPRVIRLLIACAHRVYRHFRIKLNKRNIMARDEWRCQYCGATDQPLTIDHVVPRSRCRDGEAGIDTWENWVTACHACNARKGNRTPAEAGMALLSRPRPPLWNLAWLSRRRWAEGEVAAWRPYIAGAA
jgi:5-methylcytosine-specific restriction endonuclease McrA